MKIRKAIIPIAGLGTRFLPLSKVVAKEFLPLSDKPVLHYIVEEMIASGIKEIIFVNSPQKKSILNYFKPDKKLIKILESRGKENLVKELENFNKLFKKISFKQVFQEKPRGDGDALLKAKKLMKDKAFGVAWADDVIDQKIPCLAQLIKIFNKYQKPIIALASVPKESFPFYGMVASQKIDERVWRITKIVEKPAIKEAPSNLACVGRYILTQKLFDFLSNSTYTRKGEIILNEVLAQKIAEGEEILGYEIEGKWLECGNKLAYLKSNFYLSLKHPQFGKELRKYLKNNLVRT